MTLTMPAISGKDYFVCFSINYSPPPNHVDVTNIFSNPKPCHHDVAHYRLIHLSPVRVAVADLEEKD